LSVQITDATSSYTAASSTCNASLGAGLTCEVQVRFNPTVVGSIAATIAVRDTVAGSAVSVSVSGTGTARIVLTKVGNGSITSLPQRCNGTVCQLRNAMVALRQPFAPPALLSGSGAGTVRGFTTIACSCTGTPPVFNCAAYVMWRTFGSAATHSQTLFAAWCG